MSKTPEYLKRDVDGYLAEYERLSRGLATLRDSPAFVIKPEELPLVASDPGEVIASAARQLTELRAENARLREAMEVASQSLNDIRTLRKAGKLCDPNGAGDILDLTRAAQKALLERFASNDESEDTK